MVFIEKKMRFLPKIEVFVKTGTMFVLQEGFGLLSSPRLQGKGAGWDVIPSEAK